MIEAMSQTDLQEEVQQKVGKPPKYAVIIHNDDYTTMEFVVEVLQRFFHKSGDEAAQIMLRVHQVGQGVAGVYSLEIAETKAAQAEDLAHSRGYPLKCTTEKE
jgi:ATP-dependent Clp protease adaptor protein ClpS